MAKRGFARVINHGVTPSTDTLHRANCGFVARVERSVYSAAIVVYLNEREAVRFFRYVWTKKHSCLNGYGIVDGALVHLAERGEGEGSPA